MSNFHTFGTGHVLMQAAVKKDGSEAYVALSNRDVAYDIPEEDEIPLHSTVMLFTTKESLTNMIEFLQEMKGNWK